MAKQFKTGDILKVKGVVGPKLICTGGGNPTQAEVLWHNAISGKFEVYTINEDLLEAAAEIS